MKGVPVLLGVSLCVCLLVTPLPAKADSYNFHFSTDETICNTYLGGPCVDVSANGSLDATLTNNSNDCTKGGWFTVTAMTGQLNGSAISFTPVDPLMLPCGQILSDLHSFSSLELDFPYLPVVFDDFTFAANGIDYNLTTIDAAPWSYPYVTTLSGVGPVDFYITPESSSLLSLLAGLVGVVAAATKHRRSRR